MPLCHAVHRHDYPMLNLLLDHGASVHAYPYCDHGMIDRLWYQAHEAGADTEIVRYAYREYLEEGLDLPPSPGVQPPAIQACRRVVGQGAIPTIAALVRTNQDALIQDLLLANPGLRSPPLSYPDCTIFENAVYASSWFGYPSIMNRILEVHRELLTSTTALSAIKNAITSHNRDGSADDYRQIVHNLLSSLETSNALGAIRDDHALMPFHQLAEHFCWPSNYGHKAPLSTGEDMISMARVFLTFGFHDHDVLQKDSGRTALQLAQARADHAGVPMYIDFLKDLRETK